MAKKQITDEILIAALVTHRTIKDAAQSVGVTERTIYNKMRDAKFELLYRCARTDILRGTVSEVSAQVKDALGVIGEIMHSEDASAQVRLNAAQMILTYSEKQQNRLKAEETGSMPTPPIEETMMLDMETL